MRCVDFGLDPQGIPKMARKKADVLAYAELHIEQGPVLEAEGLAVGVVTAINGFSRLRVTLRGAAGHAGTVPMNLRRDALAGAAECALAVERVALGHPELVGTVGPLRSQARRDQRDSRRGDVHGGRARAQDPLREQAVATIRARDRTQVCKARKLNSARSRTFRTSASRPARRA